MKKLSNTETELEKALRIKKLVYKKITMFQKKPMWDVDKERYFEKFHKFYKKKNTGGVKLQV